MDYITHSPSKFTPVDRLTREQASREVRALREAIEHHNYQYYVKNEPMVSDAAYDRLFRRLEELEIAYPDLSSPASPTQRVGAQPVDSLRKVQHVAPMLSLNAALKEEEIDAFVRFLERNLDADSLAYVAEPKFDGVSAEMVYRDGLFHHGSTRGDGTVGEDISLNLKTIRAVPLRLRRDHHIPSYLAVRGEVLFPKDKFQDMNRTRIERGMEPFANPRNAAAGIVRQLDPRNVADKPLDIMFYDILQVEGASFSSHWEELQRFPGWGLKTDPHNARLTTPQEVKEYYRHLLAQRDELNFEIDGAVIKLDRYEQRETLGVRARSPRWAIAWKFPPRQEITTLERIVVQVGRTGILTPVALLQPVDVGGVTVSRATLHNADEVQKKDVRPGDRVRIIRAGDVIPEVASRVDAPGLERAEPFRMPSHCPVCGAVVRREGAYHVCPAGLSCPAQLTGRVVHYASREAMNIDTLGEKTVTQLVQREMVKNLADLYHLSQEDLRQLDGFAELSARKLYEAIQRTKRVPLDRFLYALGIRHVGRHVAELLAQEHHTLETLRALSGAELEQTSGIGPEIAHSVRQFFEAEENQEVLDRLRRAGVRPEHCAEESEAHPLQDQVFVFTGQLHAFSRRQAQEVVESLGARSTSSVSGNTDYVVAGEAPGQKLDQARKLGVQVLDEDAFRKLLREYDRDQEE